LTTGFFRLIMHPITASGWDAMTTSDTTETSRDETSTMEAAARPREYDLQTPAEHQAAVNELLMLRRCLRQVAAFHDEVVRVAWAGPVSALAPDHVRLVLDLDPGHVPLLRARFEMTVAEARRLGGLLTAAAARAEAYSDEPGMKAQPERSRGTDRPTCRLDAADVSLGVCPPDSSSSAISGDRNGPSTNFDPNQIHQPPSPLVIDAVPHGVSNTQ
jgi:hypothetical protein